MNDKLDLVVRAAFLPFDIGAMVVLTAIEKIAGTFQDDDDYAHCKKCTALITHPGIHERWHMSLEGKE